MRLLYKAIKSKKNVYPCERELGSLSYLVQSYAWSTEKKATTHYPSLYI